MIFFHLYLFTYFKISHLKSEEIRLRPKLEGWILSATFVLNKTLNPKLCENPKKLELKFPFLIHSKFQTSKVFVVFLLPFILRWDDQCKVIHPKYTMNTWLIFWNCKWDWEYGKMINHGSNHGLFSVPI